MIAWIARRVVQRVYAMQNRGDHERAVRVFAHDAVFEFCGDTPFAGERRGHTAILEWFADVGRQFGRLHLSADDVAVSGPPWNMRIIVRFHDRYELINGEHMTNHGFQFMRVAWGRVKEDRILVDLGVVHDALDRIGSDHGATSST